MAGSVWWRHGLLVAGCVIAVDPCVLVAQTTPMFEVATVRPTDPNNSERGLMMSDDKFEAQGQTLRRMIVFAYGLNMGSGEQVVGGPSWVGSALFDVQAKEDEETVARLKTMSGNDGADVVRGMVRELLAERFRLTIHRETRELPVYAMTVARGGLKMTVMAPDAPNPNDAESAKKPRASGIQQNGIGELQGINVTAGILATVLGRQPEIGGRLVQDRTGLTGRYNFTLKWAPDAGMNGDRTEGAGVSLFTALQEQLGLKLEATKGPVDVVVIDSVEMPTGN